MKVTVTTTELYTRCYVHTAVFHHPLTKKRMSCEYRGSVTKQWRKWKASAVKEKIIYDLHYAGYEIDRRNIRFVHTTPNA